MRRIERYLRPLEGSMRYEMIVLIPVEGSVVIWVGGSSSSSSSAQFVRVLEELERGSLNMERYAVVVAAMVVCGEYCGRKLKFLHF